MEKTKFNRVAEDKQQLQQFAEETIDKIAEVAPDYLKVTITTSTTFAQFFELLGFDKDKDKDVSYNAEVYLSGPGVTYKGQIRINYMGGNYHAYYDKPITISGYESHAIVLTSSQINQRYAYILFQSDSLNSSGRFVSVPAESDYGKVLKVTSPGGSFGWAELTAGTKLYKHYITTNDHSYRTITLISLDPTAISAKTISSLKLNDILIAFASDGSPCIIVNKHFSEYPTIDGMQFVYAENYVNDAPIFREYILMLTAIDADTVTEL